MKPFDPNAETRKSRRNLPHWEQDGCLYFVTFRLADSLAKEQLDEWEEERAIWCNHHPPPWDTATWLEYDQRFSRKIDYWLDAGAGSCLLACPNLRQIVQDALLFFHEARYDLDCFVVMPNHVHILVAPRPGWELGRIRHSWKSFTAKAINKACGTAGEFWKDEGFDHIVRSEAHRDHYRKYIRGNPAEARLSRNQYTFRQCPTGVPPVA